MCLFKKQKNKKKSVLSDEEIAFIGEIIDED